MGEGGGSGSHRRCPTNALIMAREGLPLIIRTFASSGEASFVIRTLASSGEVIPEIERLTGNTLVRVLADAGYRGHNAPPDYRFRVFTQGQKRRVTPAIKRELRRRAAVEPVIGHLKAEHRMGRSHLAHRKGDAVNAVLAAAGYNFRLLLGWLAILLRQILAALLKAPTPQDSLLLHPKSA